mgnify:CR=1 FL=1
MTHPYVETRLAMSMGTLGKAFEFAERTLPGGMERFYHLFAKSEVAASFTEGGNGPDIGVSGIELVLSICENARGEVLDELLQDSISLSRGDSVRARWIGQTLARYQWDKGLSFRSIAVFLDVQDLERIYAEQGESDWKAPCPTGTERGSARYQWERATGRPLRMPSSSCAASQQGRHASSD